MNTSFEQNDELCRLWQGLGRPSSDKEVHEIMELLQKRASRFERTIFWRNVCEYAAAAIVSVVFGLLAFIATSPLQQLGHAIVSAGALWIVVFLWSMQRSSSKPLPESSGEAYRNALLARYDRQILLLRTAGAWYVLPLTIGLVVSSLGNDHAPELGFVMAGIMVAFGIGITILNWKAATKLAAEKGEMQRLVEEAG